MLNLNEYQIKKCFMLIPVASLFVHGVSGELMQEIHPI